MEHGNHHPMPIMAPPVLQFQSIGSFDREMEQREAAERLKRAAPKKAKGQNPAKKLKKMAEVEAKELRRFEERAAEEVLLKEVGETNWIGKVNEYRSANPVKEGLGLEYVERPSVKDPTRHTCILIIAESIQKFGEGIPFSNKKSAKKYASKLAIDWLIDRNYMPADGGVRFPKVHLLPQLPPKPVFATLQASTPNPPAPSAPAQNLSALKSAIQNNSLQATLHNTPAPDAPALKTKLPIQTTPSPETSPPSPSTSSSPDSGNTKSWASQVPELCTRLGLVGPEYTIKKASDNEASYTGYARFKDNPKIVDDKIGFVRNAFGQKRAKEEIAKEVVAFLKDIERQRLEMPVEEEGEGEEDRKRKREEDSSQDEEPAETIAEEDA